MRSLIMGIAVVVATSAAADPKLICRGAGQCVCTQTLAAKSVIGYGGDMADKVNVTCINMTTMSVSYYTVKREDALGSYQGEQP